MSIARRITRLSRSRGASPPWLVAVVGIAVTVAALAGIAAMRVRARQRAVPSSRPTLRLAWTPRPTSRSARAPTIHLDSSLAPDGRRLVFAAAKAGLVQLWLRDLSTGDTQVLPGTDEGVLPFWAPDGRAIAFFANGRLKAITLENAGITDLAGAPSAARRGVASERRHHLRARR